MCMRCRYCDGENVIKRGTIKSLDRKKKQIYFCKDCKRKFAFDPYYKSDNNWLKTATTSPQDWPSYNETQKQEKIIFIDLLRSLCSLIKDETPLGVGRPSMPIQEMVFSCVMKCYERVSSRREYSKLKIEEGRGNLDVIPHFNTVLKYFNSPKLIPILTDLITISALPLQGLEDTFAVDSSGFASSLYSSWFDYRFNCDRKVKDWLKVHAICGVKSSIVTAIKVTDGHAADSPQFPELVRNTAKFFKIHVVMGDKGYSSRGSLEVVAEVGGHVFIPFRSTATGKVGGSMLWKKLFQLYTLMNEEFNAMYHSRSNIESVFSMMKRKLGGNLMMKKEVSKVIESLAKVLCHNILCLIYESFKNGIDFDFEASAHLLGS